MKQKHVGKCNTKEETKEKFETVARETSGKLERTSFLLSPITFVRTLMSSRKNAVDLIDEIQADQIEIYVEPTVKNNAGSALKNNAMADCSISDKPNLNTDESEQPRAFPSETGNALFTFPTSKERAYFIATLLSVAFSFDDVMSPMHFGLDCSTTTVFAPGTIFIVAFVNWVFSFIALFVPYLINIFFVLLFNALPFIDAVRIFQPTCWILKGIWICRLVMSVIQILISFPYRFLSVLLPRNTVIDS
eukprot:XP_014777369.1 PREDICTED: uncharacterized protein LOC106874226 [Octopus bimaculoides]